MNNNILLSICMPTYNGGDYLIENLNSLIPQIEKTKFMVELIISDNGTFGPNLNKIENYIRQQNLRIDYVHHTQNTGVRNNFEFAVSRAHGKYVYILGDDDVLAPNFLEIVCELLALDKYSLIYFNFLAGDKDFQNSKLLTRTYQGGLFELTFEDFVNRNDFDYTFISALIFLRGNWINGLQKVKDNHYGYHWLSALLLGTALNPGLCLFFYFPIVLQRNPVKPWAKDYPVYKCIGQQSIFKELDKYIEGVSMKKYKENILPYRPTLFACVSKTPSYYVQYENDFRETLIEEDFRKLHRCLHSKFHILLYYFYESKKKLELIKFGVNKLRKAKF